METPASALSLISESPPRCLSEKLPGFFLSFVGAASARYNQLMAEVTRDSTGMLAGMTPSLKDGEFVFCSIAREGVDWQSLRPLGLFHEAEATTLILNRATAEQNGFDTSLPMRQITLEVHSALDGVGLTAAVASALSDAGIPCNVVAAFHHDHLFVPTDMAETALQVLLDVQARSRRSMK